MTVDTEGLIYQCSGAADTNTTDDPEIESLEERIQKIPGKRRWAIEDWGITGNEAAVVEAITQGKALAVTDGSYKDNWGTAALVISDPSGVNKIWARHVTPGEDRTQSAPRSETGGMYGIMVMLKAIEEQYDITEGEVTVSCDND